MLNQFSDVKVFDKRDDCRCRISRKRSRKKCRVDIWKKKKWKWETQIEKKRARYCERQMKNDCSSGEGSKKKIRKSSGQRITLVFEGVGFDGSHTSSIPYTSSDDDRFRFRLPVLLRVKYVA